jgi:16S rRNA processing protein RimM
MAERILVGAIAGAHGLRGQVRIKSFTDDPAAIALYGPVTDEAGQRRFDLTITGAIKGGVIARIAGVGDRTAAEALRGLRLYLPRPALPATATDEYYRADLIGLRAELADGTTYGRIEDVQNHGAGDVLEIGRPDGTTELLSFTSRVVPVVDMAAGRIVVEPPAVVEAGPMGAGTDG